MNKSDIIQYLSFLEDQFSKNKSTDLANGSKYDSRIDFVKDLKQKLEWQYKSQEEKRDLRVAWVRSLKKRGKNVSRMNNIIELYDSIMLTKPYLKIYLNTKGVQGLIDLCNKYLQLIDYSGRNFDVKIDEEELNTTFAPFLEESHTFDTFDLERIRNLYSKFSKLFSPS